MASRVRVVRFTQRRKVNRFPAILRAVTTGADAVDKIASRYAATVALIAKRSMKKGPKRPKSRFGQLKAYSRRSQKYGRYYWQKGMYSRPGHPPFWHEPAPRPPGSKAKPRTSGPLRATISYQKVSDGHYRIGPKSFGGRGPDVPSLHEHGGTAQMKYNSYLDRNGKRVNRPKSKTAHYPARPYMAPAMRQAKRYTRGGKNFIDRVNTMAGLRATRRAS